jgi:hypothetical protein
MFGDVLVHGLDRLAIQAVGNLAPRLLVAVLCGLNHFVRYQVQPIRK